MFKKLFRCFIVICFSFLFILCNSDRVEANYFGCDEYISGTSYYRCKNEVYTYYENIDVSTYLYSSSDIIYAGVLDGYEHFYTKNIKIHNYTYDDRSLSNENLWVVLTQYGKTLFDGSFKDSIFVDESHQGDINNMSRYRDKKVFVLTQYKKGEEYRKFLIYNNYPDELSIESVYQDEILVDGNEYTFLEDYSDLKINASGKFGVKSFDVDINNKKIEVNNGVISKETLKKELDPFNDNIITIRISDYLNNSISETYIIKKGSTNVSLSFSTIVSERSESRRIVINAIAGNNKNIDSDYTLYYWSKNPNDDLDYDSFINNYLKSSYKGSYSEDKGVILRNTSGVYYLYALAKDDNSYLVKRSDGFELGDTGKKFGYDEYDGILIVSLLILCLAPILIYNVIKKKQDY